MYDKLFDAMVYGISETKYKNNDNRFAVVSAIHLIADALSERAFDMAKKKDKVAPDTFIIDVFMEMFDKLPEEAQVQLSVYCGCASKGKKDDYYDKFFEWLQEQKKKENKTE